MAIRNIIRKAEQEYPSTTPGDLDLSTIEDLISQQAVIKSTDTYIVAEPEDNLITKYNEAKALTPNSQAKSSTNRACLIIMPGNYSLSSELAIDAQYVDIIGLGAQKLERGSLPAVTITSNTLNVTANDVRVQGISVGSQAFKIGNDLQLQRFEDCTGGVGSFGENEATVSGTFTNCTAGDDSFGFTIASGTFTNCTAGDYSFGGNAGISSGTFTNCTGGLENFGGVYGVASGIFTNCTGSAGSFTTNGETSGTFINCTAGNESFGALFSTISGTFINCTAGNASFGGNLATISGTFINCTAGNASFGGGSSTISGKFYECRLTSGTFRPVSSGGLMRNCIDGNNDIVDQ